MPIKDKSLYPPTWSEISKRVREEAGQHCQQCHVANGAVIYRSDSGAHWYDPLEDAYFAWPSGDRMHGRFEADCRDNASKIVLTVAHLDHTPSNNKPENLRALCQACHNALDLPHRKANAKKTRQAKKEQVQPSLGMEF